MSLSLTLPGRRRVRALLACAVAAVAAVGLGVTDAPEARAAIQPPQPVSPQSWPTTNAQQLAVLDYWTGDDGARWWGNAEYNPKYLKSTEAVVPDSDIGRFWTDDTKAVARTVGRLYYRQTATYPAVQASYRPGDVPGATTVTYYRNMTPQEKEAVDEAKKEAAKTDPPQPAPILTQEEQLQEGNYLLPAASPNERVWAITRKVISVDDPSTPDRQSTHVVSVSYPSMCSATSVDSPNGSTVLTGGHCVSIPQVMNTLGGAESTKNDNVIFIPGYDGTAPTFEDMAPYGLWVATQVWTTSQWTAFSNSGIGSINLFHFNYDVAALTVVDPLRPGVRLADVVGSQPVAFNQAYNQYMYAFGYPARPVWNHAITNYNYNGKQLAYCQGSTFKDPVLQRDHGMLCTMTGGASGGPWFQNFDPATGIGTVVSVNSTKYPNFAQGEGPWMIGPYFDDTIKALYDTVRVLTP